jgi:FkbM family methyltransferase
MNFANIKGRIFRYQNEFLIFLATRGFVSSGNSSITFFGNDYSGYWFPDRLASSSGTIWGVGLGMSSTFEVELGRKGYKILGFEPDLRFFDRALGEFKEIDSTLFPYGLWDRDGVFDSFGSSISLVNIFENSSGNNDSLQIRDIHKVANLLDLQNQKSPRVLKMNIEGAEREILHALIEKPLPFEVIIFQAEFLLHLKFVKVSKKLLAALELRRLLRDFTSHGYQLIHHCGNQFTLVWKSEVSQNSLQTVSDMPASN